jgi:hypothetical protein
VCTERAVWRQRRRSWSRPWFVGRSGELGHLAGDGSERDGADCLEQTGGKERQWIATERDLTEAAADGLPAGQRGSRKAAATRASPARASGRRHTQAFAET